MKNGPTFKIIPLGPLFLSNFGILLGLHILFFPYLSLDLHLFYKMSTSGETFRETFSDL